MGQKLTTAERGPAILTMARHGNGFEASLAVAWLKADSYQSDKLAEAFPDELAEFHNHTLNDQADRRQMAADALAGVCDDRR